MRVKFTRISLPILEELLRGNIQPTHFYNSDAPEDLQIVKIEQQPVDMLEKCFRVICTSDSFQDIQGDTAIPEFSITMKVVEKKMARELDYREIASHVDHKLRCVREPGVARIECEYCESILVEEEDPLTIPRQREETKEDHGKEELKDGMSGKIHIADNGSRIDSKIHPPANIIVPKS